MISVYTIPQFEKSFKRLSKKYKSLKEEYLIFLDKIEKEGVQGKSLGKGIYKARLSVHSKGKGKSEYSTTDLNILEKTIREYISYL